MSGSARVLSGSIVGLTALRYVRRGASKSRPTWSSTAQGAFPRSPIWGLEETNVEHGPRGVAVNDFLQSVSNRAVYAAGDSAATAGLPLTPVAGYEGSIVAANILEGNRRKPDYAGPTVVFSIPPLASVGLGVTAARPQPQVPRKPPVDRELVLRAQNS